MRSWVDIRLMQRIKEALNYIDEGVWLVIWLIGLAFVVIAVVGGASVVEVGLLLVLTIFVALRWATGSNVWDWLHQIGSRKASRL